MERAVVKALKWHVALLLDSPQVVSVASIFFLAFHKTSSIVSLSLKVGGVIFGKFTYFQLSIARNSLFIHAQSALRLSPSYAELLGVQQPDGLAQCGSPLYECTAPVQGQIKNGIFAHRS
jgi:hypothetical protein